MKNTKTRISVLFLALMLMAMPIFGSYAEDTTPDYVNPAGVFPISTDPNITLRLVVPSTPNIEDYETNYYTKWLEERLGCNLEFETYPMSDMEKKVQVALATKTDLPDAFLGLPKSGSSMFSVTNVVRYAEDDTLIPMNDYIDQYGDGIKAAFERYSTGTTLQQQITSADGNIYIMPVLVVGKISRTSHKLWLNQNWMEKLNLKEPTTTEELYEVLKAFKTKDPNGNGKADEIPLVGTYEGLYYSPVDYIMGSFVENNWKGNYLITDDKGNLSYAPVTDQWREGLKFINRLTSEGLLDSLTFIQSQQELKQIANDENDICGGFVSLGLNHIVSDNDIAARYVDVLPVEGPDGLRLAVDNPPLADGAGVITSECKYPELVFRLFDLMLSEEGSRVARYGEEGVDWTYPDEGELDRFGNPATLKVLIDNWGKPQNKIWWGLNPYINDIYNDGAVGSTFPLSEQKNGIASARYMDYISGNTVGLIIYPLDSVDRVNELTISLKDYVIQSIAQFAVGVKDPNSDADWEKYLKEFEAIGLDEFIDLSQDAFDSMND